MKQQDNEISKSLSTFSAENRQGINIPTAYSRRKSISLIEAKNDATGRTEFGIPTNDSLYLLHEMHMKIGATKEYPQSKDRIAWYLFDMWNTLWLQNRFIPDDIPYPIVLKEFTRAMIYGDAERFGNNQASIVQALNKWLAKPETLPLLYKKRDEVYPENKPKQLAPAIHDQSNPSNRKVDQFKDHELCQILTTYRKLYSDETGKMILDRIRSYDTRGFFARVEKEIEKRGLDCK